MIGQALDAGVAAGWVTSDVRPLVLRPLVPTWRQSRWVDLRSGFLGYFSWGSFSLSISAWMMMFLLKRMLSPLIQA